MSTDSAKQLEASLGQTRILGTPVSTTSINEVLRVFEDWVNDRRDHFVVLRDVHGVMLARRNARLLQAHQQADIVAPDGMPLVWTARMSGHHQTSRVSGPDLLLAVCSHGVSRGWRHYFYGGAPGVAEQVACALRKRLPGIQVVGTQSPPFRTLTEEEDYAICAAIRAKRPHFVWIGLGTPKQEIWMLDHRRQLGGAISLGVGAAFDFYAGLVPRAPVWMQHHGLEWSYRLAQEPKRLWRRYLKLAPMFVVLASLEFIGAKLSRALRGWVG